MAYKCGIYCIQNLTNHKRYIGSSTRIQKRKKNHFYMLRKGTHWNAHLQAAFSLHGQVVFSFTIIEECEANELVKREQYWLDFYGSSNPELGYNLNGLAGLERHTEESKRKISESNKRRYREGRVPFLLGKTHTAEVKAALGALHRGKIVSVESRARMSRAHRGKVLSAEHRKKIGDSSRGRKQPQWLVNKRTKNHNKPVLQIGPTNNILQRFASVNEAALAVGTCPSNLSVCLNGRTKTAKGFQWRFAA